MRAGKRIAHAQPSAGRQGMRAEAHARPASATRQRALKQPNPAQVAPERARQSSDAGAITDAGSLRTKSIRQPVTPPTGIDLPFGKATLARMQSRNASMQPQRARMGDSEVRPDGSESTPASQPGIKAAFTSHSVVGALGATAAGLAAPGFALRQPCKPRQSVQHAGMLHADAADSRSSTGCSRRRSAAGNADTDSAAAAFGAKTEEGVTHTENVSATRAALVPAQAPSDASAALTVQELPATEEQTVAAEQPVDVGGVPEAIMGLDAAMVAEVATKAVMEALRQLGSPKTQQQTSGKAGLF